MLEPMFSDNIIDEFNFLKGGTVGLTTLGVKAGFDNIVLTPDPLSGKHHILFNNFRNYTYGKQ
jgi:hypothetical protein